MENSKTVAIEEHMSKLAEFARVCSALRERLEQGVTLLMLVDRKRRETGISSLGTNIERMLVDRELAELEGISSPLDGEGSEGEDASDMPGWS
jgi:hypothetical protein